MQIEYVDEEESGIDIARMLGDASADGAFVRVVRLRAGKTPEQCIDRMSPEDFSESGIEYLRSNFGAGDYRAQIYAPNPRNSGRLSPVKGSARFSIAQQLPQVVNAAQNVTGLESIAIILQQQQQQTAAILQAMSSGSGEERVLGMLNALKGVITPPPPPPPPKSLVEQIVEARMLMQFSDELGGGDGDGKSKMWATAAQLLPALAPAMLSKIQQQPQPQQPLPQGDAVLPSDMYVPQTQTPTPEGNEMPISVAVNRLVTSQWDAASKIIGLMQQTPPDYDAAIEYLHGCSDEIIEFCASPNAPEKIVSMRPDLASLKGAFTTLQQRAMNEFFADAGSAT